MRLQASCSTDRQTRDPGGGQVPRGPEHNQAPRNPSKVSSDPLLKPHLPGLRPLTSPLWEHCSSLGQP